MLERKRDGVGRVVHLGALKIVNGRRLAQNPEVINDYTVVAQDHKRTLGAVGRVGSVSVAEIHATSRESVFIETDSNSADPTDLTIVVVHRFRSVADDSGGFGAVGILAAVVVDEAWHRRRLRLHPSPCVQISLSGE